MNLRDYLLEVAHTYSYTEGMDSSAQKLLRGAPAHLTHLAPAGYKVTGSGGKGGPTFTPWVGFFNPDETIDPSNGLYIVYLFSKDLRSTTLMLLQGITRLREELKGTQNRRAISEGHLRTQANRIRKLLPAELLSEWEFSVNLKSNGWRQTGYEAGNIAARHYSIDTLPSESDLRSDLWRLAGVYDRAIAARAALSPFEKGASTLLSTVETREQDLLADFYPKDHSDYTAIVAGGKQVRQRRHEWLIGEYAPALSPAGFSASTKHHPRDLMLSRTGSSWLVEAKVVRDGNTTGAVREALAQLFYYRHFLHKEGDSPSLVALFTEDIGPAYTEFLSTLNIASVWKTPTGWDGSESAVTDGIVPTHDGPAKPA
ncbi:MrcB family domain-containing protein [Kitasatospora sp. NPDC048407]|uniref:MrcB family domain-containing protein n=1 Tax=Kitasatospora sp. NPDC048407 TaxID=3364051 RepID=UPI0037233E99